MTELKENKLLVVGFGSTGYRHTQSLFDFNFKDIGTVFHLTPFRGLSWVNETKLTRASTKTG